MVPALVNEMKPTVLKIGSETVGKMVWFTGRIRLLEILGDWCYRLRSKAIDAGIAALTAGGPTSAPRQNSVAEGRNIYP